MHLNGGYNSTASDPLIKIASKRDFSNLFSLIFGEYNRLYVFKATVTAKQNDRTLNW